MTHSDYFLVVGFLLIILILWQQLDRVQRERVRLETALMQNTQSSITIQERLMAALDRLIESLGMVRDDLSGEISQLRDQVDQLNKKNGESTDAS